MNSESANVLLVKKTVDLPQSDANLTEIRLRGKTRHVPSTIINGHPVVLTGRWLKIAEVKDAELVEADTLGEPQTYIDGLKMSGLRADLFTFSQRLPDTQPRYPYHWEWKNAAVVPITTYKEWLENRVKYDVRKAVRKAERLGVVVKSVPFDDALVQGIVEIYAESPIRQGKTFWHYHKGFETVKQEAGTYLEKCEFIGAYCGDELIGFIKMAHLGDVTATIHVIAKKKHFDKKATSALLAKAVAICEQRGARYLMYGNYIYDDPASSLTEFKHRHGFEMVMFPRYYVPLTIKGRIALKLGLYHGLVGMIPESIKKTIIRMRAAINARREEWSKLNSGNFVGAEAGDSPKPEPKNESSNRNDGSR